ncbi:MAG: hypothetical protein QNJ33_12300 [Crocosphaera sp.]|nr:hypothetical protein [Crocosphaera sp.]
MKLTKNNPIRSFVQDFLLRVEMLGGTIRYCFYTPGINLLLWLIIFQMLITIALTYCIVPTQVRYPLPI